MQWFNNVFIYRLVFPKFCWYRRPFLSFNFQMRQGRKKNGKIVSFTFKKLLLILLVKHWENLAVKFSEDFFAVFILSFRKMGVE